MELMPSAIDRFLSAKNSLWRKRFCCGRRRRMSIVETWPSSLKMCTLRPDHTPTHTTAMK